MYAKKIASMNKSTNQYPGFNHIAGNISAFLLCIDIFIILLKDDSIIQFVADNKEQFRHWLLENNVREVNRKA